MMQSKPLNIGLFNCNNRIKPKQRIAKKVTDGDDITMEII